MWPSRLRATYTTSVQQLQELSVDPNRGVYESAEAVEHYAGKSRTCGLFDAEDYIIGEYFTDTDGAVLDIGCGTGRTTKPLADRGYDVTGVDKSEVMIETANDLHPDIEFQVDDAADLSYSSGVFDYVLFSFNGIDCIYPKSQRVKALREIHRVLRPGGVFAFSSHNWLYLFPALVSNPDHLRRYYLSNGNLRRLFSPYKKDTDEFGAFIHWGNPWRIQGQVQGSGFELLEWVSKRGTPLKYFETTHHYVGRKMFQ